jgi:hypothetical protein
MLAINTVANINCNSFSWTSGLYRSITNQISSGTTKLIKLVSVKLKNSFKFPFVEESLKIIFLDKKYEIITPIENEPIFVR